MNTKDFPFIDIHTHHRHCEERQRRSNPMLTSVDCFGRSSLAMTWPTYGIHPWTLDTVIARSASDEAIHKKLTLLESYLKENRIVAIGETGIDRAHKDTIPLQLEVFEKHILLSEQYQKPLIIHNVRGTADILRLHKKHQPKQAWIIHGFNGTATEANQLTDRGIYLSVGESLFYENRKIHESITSIPLDCLFFETDTSEKTIQEIYKKASELLKLPLDQLKEQIFANFARLNLDIWNNGMTEPGCSSATMALINSKTAMC